MEDDDPEAAGVVLRRKKKIFYFPKNVISSNHIYTFYKLLFIAVKFLRLT